MTRTNTTLSHLMITTCLLHLVASYDEYCRYEAPENCLDDTIPTQECGSCACDLYDCDSNTKHTLDVSDCEEIRIDFYPYGDYFWQRYSHKLYDYYNHSRVFPKFTATRYHEKGYITGSVDADKVVLKTKSLSVINRPTIYSGLTCRKYKLSSNPPMIIAISIAGVGVVICIVAVIVYCCTHLCRTETPQPVSTSPI